MMSNTTQYVRNVIDNYRGSLDELSTLLETTDTSLAFEAAIDALINMKGRLIVAGMGKSGLIGRKLAATFSSTGTPAYFVHPAEASHGDLGMIQGDDVLLLLSWSGETSELSDIITYSRRFEVTTIALTGRANSTLAKRADIALVMPPVIEACPHNLAPTTSTMLQLAAGDALAVTLLQFKGFTQDSFRNFHPGGKLGSVLTPIRDVMRKGSQMPLAHTQTPMIDVIAEISRKAFGIVGITDSKGDLVGVVTDGDIRRLLEASSNQIMQDVMQGSMAINHMTKGGITLDPDRLTARALNIMQEKKISAAFVVEDGKPVGLVTVLQLLEMGVA
jgi:arabinose-5-phosphate isomerase